VRERRDRNLIFPERRRLWCGGGEVFVDRLRLIEAFRLSRGGARTRTGEAGKRKGIFEISPTLAGRFVSSMKIRQRGC